LSSFGWTGRAPPRSAVGFVQGIALGSRRVDVGRTGRRVPLCPPQPNQVFLGASFQPVHPAVTPGAELVYGTRLALPLW